MTTNQDILDPELDVLQNIYAHADHVRQRDLAKIAGLSLGMTNAIVKRLVQKGWLTIRKVNNRNIMYAVSPAGIEQITRRSYRYFKRTIKNIVYYREAIEKLICRLKEQGYAALVLAGPSDLDFIVEHACGKNGIEYVRDDGRAEMAERGEGGLFILYSEKIGRAHV
jgi:DNA-binding MarR family transcriptional regulator